MGELFCPCPELLHLRVLEGERRKVAISRGPAAGGGWGAQGWGCGCPRSPGRGCRQQVSAGSLGSAHTMTSSAGVLFVRCASEKSRETHNIPFLNPHCPKSQPLPLNWDQQQEEREQTWQQPPRTRRRCKNSVSQALCSELQTF